jgi:hypothetical protein
VSGRGTAAAALLPLAAALALAGCAPQATEDCPGALLASLALHGTLDAGASGCVAPPGGGWVVPATLPDRAPTAADPVPTFHATFRQDAGTDAIAYCTGRQHAAVLQGARTGDHLRAEVTLSGAVLGACAATCRPLVTEVVEGDLTAGQGGAPATFAGTLTETFDGGDGPCGGCQLPCTSRYVLEGTAE